MIVCWASEPTFANVSCRTCRTFTLPSPPTSSTQSINLWHLVERAITSQQIFVCVCRCCREKWKFIEKCRWLIPSCVLFNITNKIKKNLPVTERKGHRETSARTLILRMWSHIFSHRFSKRYRHQILRFQRLTGYRSLTKRASDRLPTSTTRCNFVHFWFEVTRAPWCTRSQECYKNVKKEWESNLLASCWTWEEGDTPVQREREREKMIS